MRYIFSFLLLLFGLCLIGSKPVEDRKPNIVLILIDDLGYNDISHHSTRDWVQTPNIDGIFKNGVEFSQAYATSVECSPSRAALMSGRYQQRAGYYEGAHSRIGYPLSEKLFPEMLQKAGYKTGLIGKWHLGYQAGYRPYERGFDYFYGFLGSMLAYLPDERIGRVAQLYENDLPVSSDDHLTDEFSRQAVNFIEANNEDPFFLCLSFNAMHADLAASSEYLAKCDGMDTELITVCASLRQLDAAVGRVLKKLKSLNLDEHTVIIFANDNGGSPQYGSDNGPFRGGKHDLYEGGIRVPMAMQWTGNIQAGLVEQLSSLMDIGPTVLNLAGLDPEAGSMDGVDLINLVNGVRPEGKGGFTKLYWDDGNGNYAVRAGGWKLIVNEEGTQLYDLRKDISESSDLSAARPELIDRLQSDYTEWSKDLAKPVGTRGMYKEVNKRRKQGFPEERVDMKDEEIKKVKKKRRKR